MQGEIRLGDEKSETLLLHTSQTEHFRLGDEKTKKSELKITRFATQPKSSKKFSGI